MADQNKKIGIKFQKDFINNIHIRARDISPFNKNITPANKKKKKKKRSND